MPFSGSNNYSLTFKFLTTMVVLLFCLLAAVCGYIMYHQSGSISQLKDELEKVESEKADVKLKLQALRNQSLKEQYGVNPKIKTVRVAVTVPEGQAALTSREVHKKLASKIGYRILKDLAQKSVYVYDGNTRCGVEFFLEDNA